MKYFTKEWYRACQTIEYHTVLEEDKRAESFSEEYFKQLYNQKLTEWIQEEVYAYQVENEEIKEKFIQLEPFDREKVAKQFQELFINNQEKIKNILPEEILKKIADIRVFALDRASREVIK